MRLRISHTTEYRYDDPVQYSLQRLRLTPQDGPGQKVLSWNIAVDGANVEAGFNDQFGNQTHLVSTEGDSHSVHIVASGEVETEDRSGVYGPHQGYVPLWLYLRETPRTKPGKPIRDLARMTMSVLQYPGVLGAAALAGIDHERTLLEGHAGQAAGDDLHLVGDEDIGT